MSRSTRTASVAGRRPGAVAATSITLPPGSELDLGDELAAAHLRVLAGDAHARVARRDRAVDLDALARAWSRRRRARTASASRAAGSPDAASRHRRTARDRRRAGARDGAARHLMLTAGQRRLRGSRQRLAAGRRQRDRHGDAAAGRLLRSVLRALASSPTENTTVPARGRAAQEAAHAARRPRRHLEPRAGLFDRHGAAHAQRALGARERDLQRRLRRAASRVGVGVAARARPGTSRRRPGVGVGVGAATITRPVIAGVVRRRRTRRCRRRRSGSFPATPGAGFGGLDARARARLRVLEDHVVEVRAGGIGERHRLARGDRQLVARCRRWPATRSRPP